LPPNHCGHQSRINLCLIFFQILLIFMQRMEMLLSKTPPVDVKSDVLPMIYRALESETTQIQELCLSIIPGFAGEAISCPFIYYILLPHDRGVVVALIK
jgi:hypothetical protein